MQVQEILKLILPSFFRLLALIMAVYNKRYLKYPFCFKLLVTERLLPLNFFYRSTFNSNDLVLFSKVQYIFTYVRLYHLPFMNRPFCISIDRLFHFY